MRDESLASLESAIGYCFEDKNLLRLALMHASHRQRNNEKLEFLGDATLGFVVASAIYEEYASQTVGEIAQLRANIINNQHLCAIAKDLGIERLLTVGTSIKHNKTQIDRVCANALEAVIGAMYLDGGYDPVARFIQRQIVESRFLTAHFDKHPKSELQEMLIARGYSEPSYQVLKRNIGSSTESWQVQCTAADGVNTLQSMGSGTSKRSAELHAAQEMLVLITGGQA